MPRFFINKENISEDVARLVGPDAFHIARSLRMAVGDGITLSDGEGFDYEAVLEDIKDEECIARITEKRESNTEPRSEITLYMAYPKGDKLETVVQKAVELGAARIIPFISSRCIKRPAEDKADKQTARLNKIAQEAAKQCGRGRLPAVFKTRSVKQLCEELCDYSLVLFCYEGKGTVSLKSVLEASEAPGSIAVIVGSEGGFSPEEAEILVEKGALAVNLGPRILRCETAPDYVLSALSYRFEL